MSSHKVLADFAEDIARCVKCGACQAHCPAYLSGHGEGDVARGKIALAAALLENRALQKEIVGFERDINLCLMCGSCVTKCPNKVPTDEIVGAMRRQITEEKGLSPVGKGVSTLLGSAKLMRGAAKGGALLAPLFLRKIPQQSGLRLRFPLNAVASLPSLGGMENRTVPKPAKKSLFQRLPQYIAGEKGRPRVGFFAGCSISWIYPEIGEKMVAVLRELGCTVYLPKSQRCCGIPALSSGNGALVEELAQANITAFSEQNPDIIITACASCNGGIGEYYHTMKGLSADFSSKVMDFTTFLQREKLVERLAGQKRWTQPQRVSWHDPCHLKKQGITAVPRAILQALPNVDFIEMEGADRCCGLGGTFSVYHYDRSRKIGEKKMEGLREAGVSAVATACPGCILQLQDSINHAGLAVRAIHLLDLVVEALEGEMEYRTRIKRLKGTL